MSSTAHARSTWRASNRPRPAIALALMRRDYAITRSYRLAFVADLFFGVISLAVYYLISKTFRHTSTAQLQGAHTYFGFAAVGVAITVVIQAATAGLSQRVREEQLTGTLEALVSQPIGVTELATGLAGFPFAFASARAALYLGFAIPWLDLGRSSPDWLGVVLLFGTTAVAITSIGIALGAMVLVLKRGEGLLTLVSFGLGMLGGAVFPVSVLPGWLRPLSYIVPTHPAFTGIRTALFRGHGWVGSELALAGFAVVAAPLAIWLFGRALRHTLRHGTISQY